MKDLLFIVCTHGDESIPLEVLRDVIEKHGKENFYRRCDYAVANPKALEKNIRFTETDLNRVYPGNLKSKFYEERRAAELLAYASNFKHVIDLHTTIADSEIFTLVTKKIKRNIELAKSLFPKRIVIWESLSGRKTGPITSFLDCACEIECSISHKNILLDLEKSVMSAIDAFGNKSEDKEWYRVVDIMPKDKESSYPCLKDFRLVYYEQKPLYPLLTGQYSDKVCYLMEKIDEPVQTSTDQ